MDEKKSKPKRAAFPLPVRIAVWEKEFGKKYECYCPVCKKSKLTPFSFECGHVNAHAKYGDDTIPNLRPICSSCNKSMGTKNYNEFADQVQKFRLRKIFCCFFDC